MRDRLFLNGVNSDNIFVANRRTGTSFPHESSPRWGRGRQFRRHHFDGNNPLQLLVERLHDNPETASAKRLQNVEMPQRQRPRIPGKRQKLFGDFRPLEVHRLARDD